MVDPYSEIWGRECCQNAPFGKHAKRECPKCELHDCENFGVTNKGRGSWQKRFTHTQIAVTIPLVAFFLQVEMEQRPIEHL